MLLTGDECRRTQEGNNNAYCQDNETSWFNWDLVEENQGLLRFASALIAFRRLQPAVRSKSFLKGIAVNSDEVPDVRWYGALGGDVDWKMGISPWHVGSQQPHQRNATRMTPLRC